MSVENFRDLRALVIQRNQLSTRWFAESLTYTPRDRAARSITGAVVVTRLAEQQDPTDVDVERLEVLCLKDDADGISDPQKGDQLQRSQANDPDRRPWGFTGEVLENFEDRWRLVFERSITNLQGRA